MEKIEVGDLLVSSSKGKINIVDRIGDSSFKVVGYDLRISFKWLNKRIKNKQLFIVHSNIKKKNNNLEKKMK
jgi:hypothetical protein